MCFSLISQRSLQLSIKYNRIELNIKQFIKSSVYYVFFKNLVQQQKCVTLKLFIISVKSNFSNKIREPTLGWARSHNPSQENRSIKFSIFLYFPIDISYNLHIHQANDRNLVEILLHADIPRFKSYLFLSVHAFSCRKLDLTVEFFYRLVDLIHFLAKIVGYYIKSNVLNLARPELTIVLHFSLIHSGNEQLLHLTRFSQFNRSNIVLHTRIIV